MPVRVAQTCSTSLPRGATVHDSATIHTAVEVAKNVRVPNGCFVYQISSRSLSSSLLDHFVLSDRAKPSLERKHGCIHDSSWPPRQEGYEAVAPQYSDIISRFERSMAGPVEMFTQDLCISQVSALFLEVVERSTTKNFPSSAISNHMFLSCGPM